MDNRVFEMGNPNPKGPALGSPIMAARVNIQQYHMEIFEMEDIEDIVIQELQPNGYIKTIYSKDGYIVNYYNKDRLLLKQDVSNVREIKPVMVVSDNKPELFDRIFVIWYQYKMQDLKEKVVDHINQKENYLKIIQEQAEKIQQLESTLPRENPLTK